jgi:hypothetical protein
MAGRGYNKGERGSKGNEERVGELKREGPRPGWGKQALPYREWRKTRREEIEERCD